MAVRLQNKFFAIALVALAINAATADTKPNPNQNPNIGTWKLNLEESIPPQGKKFHPYTVVIKEGSPSLVDFTYTNIDDNGNKVEFNYKAPPDGQVRDIPGIPGLKGSMTLLPSGIMDAKLWSPDGTYENKFCILGITLRKQTCLATVTSPQGDVVFFKQVIDKQD